MSELAAGWYKDPADPVTQRYWDGEGWLGEAIPADAVPPDGPPPTPVPAPTPAVAQDAAPIPGAPAATGQPPAITGWTAPATGPQPGAVPQGWSAPQGWTPPPGWMPPPGWTPPPGWAPPPGWTPPPGWVPADGAPMAYAYQPQARPHGLALAGLGPRFIARLIDVLAVLLLNVVANGFFAYQWFLEFLPSWHAALQDPLATQPQPSMRLTYLTWIILFVATAVWFAYEVPAIGNTGQTLGKKMMGIRVMRTESTEPLGMGRAFQRWGRLGLWTPMWGCWGLGLLLQFIDSVSPLFDQKLRQALHDKTAHTVVVDAPLGSKQAAGTAPDGPASTDDNTGGDT